MGTEEENAAERLRHPRWDEVVRITGGAPGAVLIALYGDHEVLQRTDFAVEIYSPDRDDLVEEQIIQFLPADASTMAHPWREYLPKGAFPFAEDVFGDLLFVDLSAGADDPPVRHWYHDGGDIETVVARLSLFVQECKATGA